MGPVKRLLWQPREKMVNMLLKGVKGGKIKKAEGFRREKHQGLVVR